MGTKFLRCQLHKLFTPHVLLAQERFKDRIAKLIDVTDKEVQLQMLSTAHNNPASLAWAVAQRGSSELNIGASVEYVFILNRSCARLA